MSRRTLSVANQDRLLKYLNLGPVTGVAHVIPGMPGAVVHVGVVCGWNGKRLNKQWAHAHNWPNHESFGLICVRPGAFAGRGQSVTSRTPTGRARRKAGLPSIVWHEYAHLVVPGAGHTLAWRDLMRSYGFVEDAEQYRQRYAASRKKDR